MATWTQLRAFTPSAMTTAERDSDFPSPPNNLTIFNTTIGAYQVYVGERWVSLAQYVTVSAAAAPGVGDDADDLYSVGDRWIDTTNDKEYVCVDNTVGAAVWLDLYHAEAHAPESHTGQGATGTELETLTDGSNSDSLHIHGAAAVGLPLIGSPTYTHVEHLNTVFHSSGWIGGGAITDAGGATINVAAGDGMLRASDSEVAQLKFIEWPANNGLAITADSRRYVGVELNDPNDPQVVVRTSYNWNFNTDFPLGTVVNEAGTLHRTFIPHKVGDHASNMIQRVFGVNHIAYDAEVAGIAFSETGTRNVVVSAGQLWVGLDKKVIGAIDTSGADTFDGYSSQGKEDTGISQWSNLLYDNGSGGVGTLQTLGSNKWANLWWYVELDGHLVMVYGSAQYTSAAKAGEEAIPTTLPNRLQEEGKLAARFIFQKSAATAAQILSAFITPFLTQGVTDHGNLGGVTSGQHHTEVHGTAGHTGKIGEVPVEIHIVLANPIVSNADTTLLPGYEYKDVWGNAVRKIRKWYLKFGSALGGSADFALHKNGTIIAGSKVTVASADESAVKAFDSEVTLADGDVLTVVQDTTTRTDAIQGVAHVYGREEVVTTVTYS